MLLHPTGHLVVVEFGELQIHSIVLLQGFVQGFALVQLLAAQRNGEHRAGLRLLDVGGKRFKILEILGFFYQDYGTLCHHGEALRLGHNGTGIGIPPIEHRQVEIALVLLEGFLAEDLHSAVHEEGLIATEHIQRPKALLLPFALQGI